VAAHAGNTQCTRLLCASYRVVPACAIPQTPPKQCARTLANTIGIAPVTCISKNFSPTINSTHAAPATTHSVHSGGGEAPPAKGPALPPLQPLRPSGVPRVEDLWERWWEHGDEATKGVLLFQRSQCSLRLASYPLLLSLHFSRRAPGSSRLASAHLVSARPAGSHFDAPLVSTRGIPHLLIFSPFVSSLPAPPFHDV
jgi:hypothetical protein